MFSTITSFKTHLGPKLFSIGAIEKKLFNTIAQY